MATKLRDGNYYEVRLVISAEFWEMAERVATREPLIGGPEGYIQAVLNTALLGEEERLAEKDIRQEKLEGRYKAPEVDPEGDVPF